MEVIPALDLINGNVVRLRQGKYDDVSHYDATALEWAVRYEAAGAKSLHLVDLDGAKMSLEAKDGDDQGSERTQNPKVIAEILQSTTLRIQVGGGVRSMSDIQCLLDAGIDRVVVGSMAVTKPEIIPELVTRFGAKAIIIAVDLAQEEDSTGEVGLRVLYRGWKERGPEAIAFVQVCVRAGIEHILCTDISRDGMLQGPNLELYSNMVESFPDVSWIASGGVAERGHIPALRATGVRSVVIGKALLEGKITPKDAFTC